MATASLVRSVGPGEPAPLTDPPAERIRRFPVGAEVIAEGRTDFRVWAPRRRRVEVVLEEGGERGFSLLAEGNGYFSGTIEAGPGTRYRYRLDGDTSRYPDPASRYQPDGPHGPSEVIDPTSFVWKDVSWTGARPKGRVIYEMHIGTFTPEGTWAAGDGTAAPPGRRRCQPPGSHASRRLPRATSAGATTASICSPRPACTAGPTTSARFVDRAHALGLGVILDVVYNHLGPDGNYLSRFSSDYFNERHKTDWGEGLNFDGPNREPVREFYTTNAAYWIDEFHLDGLRLDATQSIRDDSPDEHILAAIVRAAAAPRPGRARSSCRRERAAGRQPGQDRSKKAVMVWTCSGTTTSTTPPAWRSPGRSEAYYSDYRGLPQELLAAVKHGFLFQGQYYTWQKQRRGTPSLDLPPHAFVTFLDNHDQVSNSTTGVRTHALTSPAAIAPSPLCCCWRRQRPCCSRARSSPRRHHFTTLPITSRNWPSWSATAGWNSCRSSPVPPNSQPRPCPNHTSRAPSRAVGSTSANSSDTPGPCICTATCCALRRDDPTFSLQRHRGLDGTVLGPEALRAALLWRGTGPRSLAAVQSGHRPGLHTHAGAVARPAGRNHLATRLVERGSALRRRRIAVAASGSRLAAAGTGRVRAEAHTEIA